MRVRGRKATSNPTSPLSEPRRQFPEQNAHFREALDAGFCNHEVENHSHKCRHSDGHNIEHIATVRGKRNRNTPNAQGLFEHDHSCSSNSSSYDNIGTGGRRKLKVECDNQCPHNAQSLQSTPKTKYRPIGEREIPYSEHQDSSDASESVYQSRTSLQRETPEPIYQSRSTLQRENLESILFGSNEKIIEVDEETAENNYDEIRRESKVIPPLPQKQELRQFSREPTCIDLADRTGSCYEQRTTDYSDYDVPPVPRQFSDPPVSILKHSKTKQAQNRKEVTSNVLSLPRKSHSSSSPDWPPPPDSLEEPASPYSPSSGSGFDSCTLRRMLQNLPDGSPSPKNTDSVFEYTASQGSQHACQSGPKQAPNCSNNCCSSDKPSIIRDKTSNNSAKMMGEPTPTLSHFELKSPPGRSHKIGLDSTDLKRQKGKTRDSYPDSGISGMTNDTTSSVRSGDSGRSGRSGRSGVSSLPPGLGLSSLLGKSTTSSSGGSSSGRHSDLIKHSVGDASSDATRVRHITSSDVDSDSGSESDASDSSIHTMYTETQSTFASKSTAVRKAGWLTVKNWLIHKKRKVDLAPRRTWKKYWVCLKGTMLLFYTCDDRNAISDDSVPRHMLVIEGGIAQAVPEHPKRENIFSLSTAFGDAYLFEAPSQIELENWINGIHSACASSFARQHGKENTLKLLRTEIQKLENSIDLDIKMKKMADLQLKVVSDPKNKQAIEKQIAQWNENLEKLYIEQYRLRCYMASLQGSELPNPKNVLSYVSKQTKAVLSRVGVFTVTSFHALVCARTPLNTSAIYNATSGNKKKSGILSTFKADTVAARMRSRSPVNMASQQQQSQNSTINVSDHVVVDLATKEDDSPQLPMEAYNFGDNLLRIQMPSDQTIIVGITEKMSVGEVLDTACNKRQLNPTDHFMRFRMPGSDSYKIPEKNILLSSEEFDAVEVCSKKIFQVELNRDPAFEDKDLGMSVEAELAEDTEEEDELCVFISELNKGGCAYRTGLTVGDEILVMNGRVISELDMVYVENLLQDESHLTMTVRSCRVARPSSPTLIQEHADMYIENMMCPPPPSQSRISDKVLEELVIPAPHWVNAEHSDDSSETTPRVIQCPPQLPSKEIHTLLHGAEQVTHFCRLLHEKMPESATTDDVQPKPLSESQRIRKVIVELIETEKQYVKDLNCLIERYLEPLKEETFLSGEDIEALFGNIQEIVQFQKLFLQSLEAAVELEDNFSIFNESQQFRRILFSVGGAFLHYANHFKLYSSFCASHSKAQKVLVSGDNDPLHEFLRARNPKQQHSATLESYLIKPIQRILKYPLLLKQLKEITDTQSDEHKHLSEALKGMETVAEHINEMQKIYEEYGNIFDELHKSFKEERRKAIDLNVGDLQMYGNVNWLNALDELGKIKKGTEIVTMLFVFKAGIVILAQERLKGKRRVKGAPPIRTTCNGDPPDVIRFQVAIPVNELQVRQNVQDHSERQGMWELVHCRSELEGRPERLYQYQSSYEARRDFMKTIHNTIRESVRKMSIPGGKQPGTASSAMNRTNNNASGHMTNGQSRRPDSLTPVLPNGSRTVGKKRSKQLKGDIMRYSMNIEDRVDSILESADHHTGDFTRSHTLTDLNDMDLQQSGSYPYGSQSTIASENSRTSAAAKLLHTSNNPTKYSNQNLHKDGLGSPVWKPRHSSKTPLSPTQQPQLPARQLLGKQQQLQQRHSDSSMYTGSAYGNYSNIVYDNKNSAVLLTPPNATLGYDDGEC